MKKQRNDIYYKAAIRMAEGATDGACVSIAYLTTGGTHFCALDNPKALRHIKPFEEMLKPTDEEIMLYEMSSVYWLRSRWGSNEEDRNVRVLALLLMDQIVNNPCYEKT